MKLLFHKCPWMLSACLNSDVTISNTSVAIEADCPFIVLTVYLMTCEHLLCHPDSVSVRSHDVDDFYQILLVDLC